MLDEDIPHWEHTVVVMAKIKIKNTAIDANEAWELAKDDSPEAWYIDDIDWNSMLKSDTERIS